MSPRKNLMEFFSRRSPNTPSQQSPDQPDKEDQEAGSAGVQGSGSKRRRPVRRCVRKLPLDLETDGIEGEGEDEGVADGGGGSGGRKLTKTAGKTTPRSSRRAKCKNASNNENHNSQGPIGSQNEECAAPSSVKKGSDFFIKLSEKRKRRKRLQQEKGEHVPGDTRIADEMHQQLRMSKDNFSSSEENGLHSQIRMLEGNHFAASNQSDHCSPAKAVDLRLEAKRAAEENARLFAGKQIHPFFVSCQASKRLSEICHLGSRYDSVLQEDMTMPYAPLHVLQTSLEDEVLLIWQDWVFFEENVLKCADPINIDNMTLAWSDGSKPLKIDSFVNIPNLSQPTFLEQQIERRKSGSTASTSSPFLTDQQSRLVELEAHDHAPVDITKNHVCGELDDKRMKPYYLRCSSFQPDANLWVDKYRPDGASEVCGNSDSVKFINEWMHSWYIQNPVNDKSSSHNDDLEWIEDDDDVDDMDGVALKNILLLTGPIGSGKSAAIYACAKEQGFQIIEVSASDWRSGTLVKQKFREAMESECLKKWSNEDFVGSQNQHGMRTFPIENKSLECGNSRDIGKNNSESVSSCLEQENALEMEVSCNFMECRSLDNQVASKTLILFEDFDATLDEDRGLIATILELAETTKRPIILTSNSRNPILPPLVDRVTVNFALPSVDELVSHAYMICASEATNVSLQLIEHVVRFCVSDIRKILMFLQFWCQGGTDQQGKSLCAHGPVPFNIDAGHYVIQKVIPWGFPSHLSEYIEKEVSKSLAKMKAIALLMDETTQELGTAENLEVRLDHENEGMSEDGLSKWMPPIHDFALESSIFSDISPSNTVETTKQTRQKRCVVSDSEDEPYVDKLDMPEQLPQHLGEQSLLDMPNNSFSMQEYTKVSYLDATLHENPLGGPKTNGDACTHYLNGSPKISCIPELSFVPETKIENGYLEQTSSVACFPDMAQNTCLGSSDMLKELGMMLLDPVKTEELDRVSETVCWGACGTVAESPLDCNDSHLEPPQAIFRTYPLIDECSRADCSNSFVTETKLKRLAVADLVQETWKKLRSQGTQVKFCIETEQCASSSLKIASGLTELISDADVMLSAGCVLVKDPAQASIFDEGDQHVDLMSTFAEHGLCFYANKSAPLRRHLDPAIKLDLASEILVSSMDSLTIGKLVAQESGDGSSSQLKLFEELMEGMLPDRLEENSMLSDALLTVVPIRSYMASRGSAFHEYLSFLSQISKGESTRLAQEGESRRCGRGSRHYLRTGASSMSAEGVLLLDQHACYKKRDPKSTDEG